MSSIAKRVGGSKTTLWSYFPSKESLFAAVVDDVVEQYGVALGVELSIEEPLETVLRRFGFALLKTVLSGPILSLHRLVVGDAARFPELAEMFFERGAKRGHARLARYLGAAMDIGLLRPTDAMVAARQFTGLCLSGCFQSALLGLEEKPPNVSIEFDLENAVNTAVSAWT